MPFKTAKLLLKTEDNKVLYIEILDSTDSDETDIDENETQDDPYEGLKISGGGCSCGLVF